MTQFYRLLSNVSENNEPFALGIISDCRGSSPQKKGAKAIFYQDGRILGTIGGGCLEAEVQARARAALVSGKPAIFDLLLDHDFGWDDGLICGGLVKVLILPNAFDAKNIWQKLAEVKSPISWGIDKNFNIKLIETEEEGLLYQEIVFPQCNLWIAGAGHIARAVAPMAVMLGFSVTVFDDRPSVASPEFFPKEVSINVGDWNEMLSRNEFPDWHTFGLIITRGHRHDALVLKHWIHKPFSFLGMIGSRRKARIIFDEFKQQSIATEEILARVHCPVGLQIHSQTVPEIAVSIVAQLVQVRAEKVYGVRTEQCKK
ncbi:MAG: XdhC family protein [Limisphaerales bacterium]|jgi:xanthine dehydrogenase accessory factor